MPRPLAAAALLLGALLAADHPASAQQAPLQLADVLDRIGTYLARYSTELSRMVANERYKQTAGTGPGYAEAILESEFGIINVPGYQGWLGFRDVLRVNGRSVQDHESRLQELLLRPSPVAYEQALRITEASARYNIGSLQRTINNPAIVLEFFDRRNHPRLLFAKTGEDTIDRTPVWIISFEERARPTLIRTPQGRDVPATGLAWVEPSSGALISVELNVRDFFATAGFGTSRAQMRVFFNEDPRLKLRLPARLTEVYEVRGLGLVTGEATYTNYRQFGTETTEELSAPSRLKP